MSLASFRPRPVIARTTLITPTFCSPAEANTTSNSVFSSAAAAPAPAGPATATAAAETPNFSSKAFNQVVQFHYGQRTNCFQNVFFSNSHAIYTPNIVLKNN